MTREEARQIITAWLVSSKGEKEQLGYIEGWFDEEDVEAFQMAIKALEQEPCDDCVWFRQGVQRTQRGYAYERKTK